MTEDVDIRQELAQLGIHEFGSPRSFHMAMNDDQDPVPDLVPRLARQGVHLPRDTHKGNFHHRLGIALHALENHSGKGAFRFSPDTAADDEEIQRKIATPGRKRGTFAKPYECESK
jgi:hypothetical protein